MTRDELIEIFKLKGIINPDVEADKIVNLLEKQTAKQRTLDDAIEVIKKQIKDKQIKGEIK